MGRSRWQAESVGARVVQSGLATRPKRTYYDSLNGLLMRGVVTATYVVDDPNHPILTLNPDATPVAVYCDVLCYTSMRNQRWQMLKQVLVSQPTGGLHRGRIWKPRAAKLDITGNEINMDGNTNPANLDGDHVLVGFIDDNSNTPVIISGIPHPSNDVGNERSNLGQRMKLKEADGDPDFWKHHGSHYGIDTSGNFRVDTTWANDGVLATAGQEELPPDDGKGQQNYTIPLDAHHQVDVVDMSPDPLSPTQKVVSKIDKDQWFISFLDNSVTLLVDGTAKTIALDVAGTLIVVQDGQVTVDSALIELGDGATEQLIKGTIFRLEHALMHGIVQAGFTGLAAGFTAVGIGWGGVATFGGAMAADPAAISLIPTSATAAGTLAGLAATAATACGVAAGLATAAATAIGNFELKTAQYLSLVSKTK